MLENTYFRRKMKKLAVCFEPNMGNKLLVDWSIRFVKCVVIRYIYYPFLAPS